MVNIRGVPIARVIPGSIAAKLGIEPQDRLLTINGEAPRDILEYQYLSLEESLNVTVAKNDGRILTLKVEKDCWQPLGLEFQEVVFDGIRKCVNRCIFCFVDQLPGGLRKSLYLKDDDYRLSFLYGNFITLTNLGKRDWNQILTMRLSPLYVSVHAANPEIRERMLGNRKARNIIKDLTRLKEGGIQVHTQIVVCPGINDKEVLEDTIEKLADLWPSVRSVGVVPVGLTRFRDGLEGLRGVTTEEACDMVEKGMGWHKKFRERFGVGFVYLADEFFIKSDTWFPPSEYYDGYPQLENGIGISRRFLDGFLKAYEQTTRKQIDPSGQVNLVCGWAAMPVMRVVQEKMRELGLSLEVIAVENSFFGREVDVTGLVTGSDLVKALGTDFKGQELLIPSVMLRDGQGIFLDDMTLEQLREHTGADIRVVEMDPRALIKALLTKSKRQGRRLRIVKTSGSHSRPT